MNSSELNERSSFVFALFVFFFFLNEITQNVKANLQSHTAKRYSENCCFFSFVCWLFQLILKINVFELAWGLPDLPELITPPVSSHADDDDDDLVSSSTISPLLKIDSSDVHRLFEEPFLLFRAPEFNSFIWPVCVDIVLHVPFVMGMSSKSSSILSTGKLLLLLVVIVVLLSYDVGNSVNCFAYCLPNESM